MTGMAWQLFVIGLLLYGLIFTAIAPLLGSMGARRLEIPDHRDAPISVTRRDDRSAAEETARSATTRTSKGWM
jgi:hypothetical protein